MHINDQPKKSIREDKKGNEYQSITMSTLYNKKTGRKEEEEEKGKKKTMQFV